MTGSRPVVVVLVAGTGTEVGKTWVADRLLAAWRGAGLSVAARKPAQSFVVGHEPTDADVLGSASGEDPATVCLPTRWYPVPLAPPMAADVLGRPVPTIDDLVAELAWPVATVDVVDMVSAIAPDHVVLVADAGLGTINAVRLSVGALTHRAAPTPAVILNRFDPSSDLHRRNLAWLHDNHAISATEATASSIESLAARLARPATPA